MANLWSDEQKPHEAIVKDKAAKQVDEQKPHEAIVKDKAAKQVKVQ